MLTFLDKNYTPASKKNMHAERTNILVKHLGQEAFMFTDVRKQGRWLSLIHI